MLRQLAHLTRPVAAAGERACAIAVYADAAGHTLAANERGREGVACVDDAARALVLCCDLWDATHVPLLREWAKGLLDFVIYMQRDDGRFVNFIADWSGRRNEDGATSVAGGGFWQARAARGLARAAVTLEDPRAVEALERALPALQAPAPPDVRAIQALTAMHLLRAGRHPELRAALARWCDEIAAARRGDVLLDNPDQTAPHLWGHLQEGVLAEAGAYLGRAEFVEVARRSALAYLAPLVDSGFDEPTTQPYGVACAVYAMDRLDARADDPIFDTLGKRARAWFDGRNATRLAVYDRVRGRVCDGIDDGRLNQNSGAEANILGAQALFAEVRRGVRALAPALAATLGAIAPAARSVSRPVLAQ